MIRECEVSAPHGGGSLIRIRELRRTFDQIPAVDGIELEIMQGEIFGLVGPDGAGKTTVLRLLCGLMKPSGGTAEIGGVDVLQDPERIRDSIGYMPQRFGLYSDLSVSENLHFYAELFGLSHSEREPLMKRLLHMTRLEPFTERFAGQLSGGMKQKLALSCALLHKPEVLFLDEPTTGVDPISRREFWAILYQLVKDGVTVVITTSYLDEAERCNRVALLNRGMLVDCDTPDSLRGRYRDRFFSCSSRDRASVRRYLLERPEIISAEPAGSVLHVCVEEAGLEADFVSSLPAEVEEFQSIEPSLEDVFIAMISEEFSRREERNA